MEAPQEAPAVFLVRVRSERERACARILIDSIRRFGGAMSAYPVRVFASRPDSVPCDALEESGVEVVNLSVPPSVAHYEYGDKVYACMVAEESAPPSVHSLVYLTADSLVLKPPDLFGLSGPWDAAVRPVHIKNVGLGAGEVPDAFWSGVYGAVGGGEVTHTVLSYVDQEHIRAYFNSAAFAVRPGAGLFRRWFECFQALVKHTGFQAGPCADERHRIFLHQAVLSTIIATSVEARRVRVLPWTYGYPYNLHGDVAPERQAARLDDLVCAIYHERSIDPRDIDDIGISASLRSWLASRAGPALG
jgi:hypothetical protein